MSYLSLEVEHRELYNALQHLRRWRNEFGTVVGASRAWKVLKTVDEAIEELRKAYREVEDEVKEKASAEFLRVFGQNPELIIEG